MSFFALPRGWMDHPVLADDEPFSRREAWAWMNEKAAFAETRIRVGGRIVTLQRGQLCYSLRALAERWKWGHEKVRRFLRELKSETMVETETETGQMLVTICNYDDFLPDNKKHETATETTIETPARQPRDSHETVSDLPPLDAPSPPDPHSPLKPPNPGKTIPRLSAREAAERMAAIWREEMRAYRIPVPSTLNEKRIRACAARWQDVFHENEEEWRAFLARIRASPYLMGQIKQWRVTFDFAIQENSCIKILDGNYDPANEAKPNGHYGKGSHAGWVESFAYALGGDPEGDSDGDCSAAGPFLGSR